MKLILHCSSSNENYSDGCDYALVDLNAELARLALRRIEMLNDVKRKDDQAHELHFWDYAPDWFSPYPQDNGVDGQTEEDREKLEALVDDVESGGFKIIPDDTVIPDAFHARTECNFMGVQDDDIGWSCYPKHSDITITITTGRIGADVIRGVLEVFDA